MCRPLCARKELLASIKSSALAAAFRARGGVRNRRSAQAPARSGNSRCEAANRTFVLILGSEKAWGMASSLTGDQFVQGGQGARPGFGIAEQAPMVVYHQR